MSGPARVGRSDDESDRWGFARLTRRAEFQRVSKGRRDNRPCLTLQAAPRPTNAEAEVAGPARIGLTLTRKVGCAVERNRIRRRLRAALGRTPTLAPRAGYDYVVVARREALTASYETLCGNWRGRLNVSMKTGHATIVVPGISHARRKRRPTDSEPRVA